MKVYKVIIIQISIRSGIEGFNTECNIFANIKNALTYAHYKATKYNDKIEVIFSYNGNYIFNINKEYGLAEYEIKIEEDNLNFESESIISISIGDNYHNKEEDYYYNDDKIEFAISDDENIDEPEDEPEDINEDYDSSEEDDESSEYNVLDNENIDETENEDKNNTNTIDNENNDIELTSRETKTLLYFNNLRILDNNILTKFKIGDKICHKIFGNPDLKYSRKYRGEIIEIRKDENDENNDTKYKYLYISEYKYVEIADENEFDIIL
jgi:hypothetical protein